MAEPGSVAAPSRPATRQLEVTADPSSMLAALDATLEAGLDTHLDTSLDTQTLFCLRGDWPLGKVVIGWAPRRTVTDLTVADGPGWFGWQAFDQSQSWWGQFDMVLVGDAGGAWTLQSMPGSPTDADDLDRLAREVVRCLDRPQPAAPDSRLHLTAVTDRDRHLAAVEHAISAIRAGTLYQVNICARVHGELDGSPVALFNSGVDTLSPAYAAFLRTPERSVVSFSPELFLHRQDTAVRTAPIKGTRRRAPEPRPDPGLSELRQSVKDRAENIMIVDLMRNDLARVSVTGSVTTPSLLQIVPAPGVWHLVSEVSSTLLDGVDDQRLLAATFPPGSVTGAPKLAALELIGALEDQPRGIFTGAIGYLDVGDSSALNVAIRTLEFDRDGRRFELGVGGGITADSVPMQEWRECLIKAAPLLALGAVNVDADLIDVPADVEPAAGIFETILAIDGTPIALPDHLARLEASLSEVYGRALPDDLARQITLAARGSSGRQRVRASVAGDGSTTVTVHPVDAVADSVALHTHAGRTGSWRHKWNDRRWLTTVESDVLTGPVDGAQADLPLFVTDVPGRRLVCETSRSNVALVVRTGVLVTPPLTEDVLPGVRRRRLLDAALDRGWRVELRPVELHELLTAPLTVAVNSLGLAAVRSVDGTDCPMDQELLGVLRSWFAGELG